MLLKLRRGNYLFFFDECKKYTKKAGQIMSRNKNRFVILRTREALNYMKYEIKQ